MNNRKDAERNQLMDEDIFRFIWEEVEDYAIITTDLGGIITGWNVGAQRIFGYHAEEAVGQSSAIIFTPEDREQGADKEEMQTAAREDQALDERWHIRKDGSLVFLSGVLRALKNRSGNTLGFIKVSRDATKRQNAELALLAEKNFSNAIISSLPGIFYLLTEQGKFLRWNKNLEHVTNYSAEEISCMHPLDFFNDQEQALIANAIQEVFENGEAKVEASLKTKAGDLIPHLFTGFRVVLSETNCLVGVGIDISERKRAEEERERLFRQLESERSRLEQILQQMPAGVAIAEGPSGRLIFHNDEAIRLIGHPMLESYSYNQYTQYGALHPNGEPYKGEDYPIARALFSGEVIKDEEMIYRRGDGKLTILSVSATPIHDNAGKIIASVSTFSDIFEMKRAEAARERLLREANAARVEAETANTKLEVLLSVTDAALATLSLDDLLNELLSRLREILHTDTATILLVTPDKKSLKVCASRGLEEEVSEETIIPIGQGFAGQIAASRKPQVAENISEVEIVSHVMRAKGISSLLGVPLIVGEELIGVLHVGTFRIHHFSSYDVQLLELVADRAAIAIDRARLYEAARKAHKEAEEANRSKDAFIATVSHELRNPLNSILGYARLLREGKLPPSGINHAIEIIERSTKAQARLIEDLLDISRISSGRVRLDLQTVDFSSLVQSALDMVRPSATAKNIKLLLALDSNAAPVLGDPMRLQQVVSNLLVNAIKFTPPNGQVEISLNQKGSRLELAVSDTGKGISREFLPHVFEQFRQESGTQHTGGLGLGLSIVRHLVELHGGTVIAESQGLGKGATFVVRLPVKNIEEGKENVQAVLEEKGWLECQPSIEGVKILLVEDEPDTRELMTALLEDCLANVTAVASLSEAIEAIRGEKPDVLLSDIGLPDGDGYELVRRVRALMQDAEIPAAAVTAFAEEEAKERAYASGFQAYLAKPVDPDDLLRVIADLAKRV